MFALISLIQSVAASGGVDLSQIIQTAAGMIVVGAMGWMIKATRDVKIAITRLTDCLFGYTGTNGLNKDVEILREDVDDLLERRRGNGRRRDDRETREDLP